MAYGTDAGLEAWLAEQGHTLPDDAPSLAVLRARGSAYVDGYEAFWTGQRTGGVMQEAAWPRTGATVGCTVAVPDGVIPPAVVNASYRAAWLEAANPGVLFGIVSTGPRVKREKVDVLESEYFEDKRATVGGGPAFVDPQIDGMLRAFVCEAKGGAFLWALGT